LTNGVGHGGVVVIDMLMEKEKERILKRIFALCGELSNIGTSNIVDCPLHSSQVSCNAKAPVYIDVSLIDFYYQKTAISSTRQSRTLPQPAY